MMINGIDIESHLVSRYNNDEYYKSFSELSRSNKDDPSTAMVECEINCVSYLDERSKKVYTFILKNENNR